jgi:hypothetical protein
MRFIIAGLSRCQNAFTQSVLKELNSELVVLPSKDHIHKLKGYEDEPDVQAHVPIPRMSTFNAVVTKKSR